MKRHQIDIYQSDPAKFERGPTFPLIVFFLGCILTLILLAAQVPLLILFTALGLLVMHSGLFLTNERLGMNRGEVEFWKTYRSLDKGTQNRIPLTPAIIKAMPNGTEWHELVDEINGLKSLQDRRKAVEARSRGEFIVPREAIQNEAKVERERLAEADEIHKELKARQLI